MWSIGIGLTNKCNLACPHCYSRCDSEDYLSLEKIKALEKTFDIEAINLGTGESYCHPEFRSILEFFHEKRTRVSLTSNGYSVLNLEPHYIRWFHDIDVSLDFPTAPEQDAFRGSGAWDMAIQALEKCKRESVTTSIVSCIMNINYQRIGGLLQLAKTFDCSLRVNIYKSVRHARYRLSYEEFWSAIRELLRSSLIHSISEPIVNACLPKEDQTRRACPQNNIRSTPQGHITPCVYLRTGNLTIDNLPAQNIADTLSCTPTFQDMHYIPEYCRSCPQVEICQGGCACRRYYDHGIETPDIYCPLVRNESIKLAAHFVDAKEQCNFVHASYLCTIICKAR
jgi:radical SAM protein with 4Fe4S-binding SPASM domain